MPEINEPKKALLRRLRRGQQWLTEQHLAWVKGNTKVSDAEFSKALAGWEAMERVLRCSDYKGCIWGEGKTCPGVSPVSCGACCLPVTVKETREAML